MQTTKQAYLETIKDIRSINRDFAAGHYDLSHLIHVLFEAELFKLHPNQYRSRMLYAKEQLPFSYATCQKYLQLWDGFKRLKYTKSEALALMESISWNVVAQEIPYMERKLSIRAFKKRISESGELHQMVGTFSASDMAKINKVLCDKHGLEINAQTGQRRGLSQALLSAITGSQKKATKAA